MKKNLICCGIMIFCLAVAASHAFPAPAVPRPSLDPSAITVGRSTPVTIWVELPNPASITGSVNLLLLDESGKAGSILGSLRDDGLAGDARANDGVYTLRKEFTGEQAGRIRLQVSVPYKGMLKRVLSEPFEVAVQKLNEPPLAKDQSVTTDEDRTVAVTLVGTDPEGDPLTYLVVSPPAHGTLSGTAPNLTYTPWSRYQGLDSFTFKANDGRADGNIATVSITVQKKNPLLTLTITSPPDGATISRSDIRVEGTVINTQGYETGVTVNGILAQVYGDQFFVNHVPLEQGENTVTAKAMDVKGNKETASIVLNALTAVNYIRIAANVDSGIAPLEAVLTLDSNLDLTSASLTYEGPGEVGVVPASKGQYRVRMEKAGAYKFVARVEDAGGVAYEDVVGISALSREEINNLLADKWEGMRARLAGGDIEGSLTFFEDSAREDYREILQTLGPFLSEIVSEMADIQLIKMARNTAIYDLRAVRDGKEYSFQLLFTKDADGIWRVDSF
jgi:hypothetical protein